MSTSLSLTGTIGGVKISDLIAAQDAANRAGAVNLQTQETGINAETAALTDLQTSLTALYDSLGNLAKTSLYESKAGSLANPAMGNVSVNSSAATNGTWDLNVLQVATASTYIGTKASSLVTDTSKTLASVLGSGVVGSFRVGVVGGTQQTINVDSTTTIQGVLDAINGSGAGVTASFDTTTGEFTVASSTGNASLLLSAGTSDFLQQAQLFNNYSALSGSTDFGDPTAVPSTEKTMSQLFSGFQDGTFSVNGVGINVTGSMKLSDVISAINAQVPGIQAQSVNGKLVINSTTPVIVANGTGSFFNQAGLTTSTATSTTSSNAIGALDPDAAFGTAGSITINGTTVNYSATDTLNTLLASINNNSQTGVVAVYDSFHDRIGFVSDTAGPQAIEITNVSGPLAGMGIVDSSGTEAGEFTAGNSAVVSVNGGPSITSDTNTFTSDTLGIAGVTFNAAAVGETTVSVAPDVSTIEQTIDAFVVQYNATQTLLAQYTDPNGVTTVNPDGSTSVSPPGLLVNDSSVNQISFTLRSIFGSALYANTSAGVRTLSDLGIEGNANDNTATTTEPTLLTNALTFNLNDVLNVFANPVNGLYAKLSNVILTDALGGASIIGNEISNNNQQISDLDNQISTINEQADAKKILLEQEYANYESTFSTSQSTASFLSANTGGSGGSSSSSTSDGTSGIL